MASGRGKAPDPWCVFRGHKTDARAVEFHPGGNLLFSGDADGELKAWDLTQRRLVFSKRVYSGAVGVVAIKSMCSKSGQQMVLTQGRDGAVKQWHLMESGLSQDPVGMIDIGSYSYCKLSVVRHWGDRPVRESSRGIWEDEGLQAEGEGERGQRSGQSGTTGEDRREQVDFEKENNQLLLPPSEGGNKGEEGGEANGLKFNHLVANLRVNDSNAREANVSDRCKQPKEQHPLLQQQQEQVEGHTEIPDVFIVAENKETGERQSQHPIVRKEEENLESMMDVARSRETGRAAGGGLSRIISEDIDRMTDVARSRETGSAAGGGLSRIISEDIDRGVQASEGAASSAVCKEEEDITGLLAAQDQSLIAIAGSDPSTVEVWSLSLTKQVLRLSQGSNTSDGNPFPVSGGRAGTCMAVEAFRQPHTGVLTVAAGFEDGAIRVWDVRQEAEPLICQNLHTEPILSIALDGLYSGGVSGAADNRTIFFRLDCLTGVCNVAKMVETTRPGTANVAIRPDDRIAATGGWDHRVRVYDYKRRRPLAILKYHSSTVSAVAFSPFQIGLLASASDDATVALWDIYPRQGS